MSIITICKRRHTSHLRVTLQKNAVRLEYGNFKDGKFEPIHREDLSHTDYPELTQLFDGVGWNILNLADVVREVRDGELDMGVHIFLQPEDMDLLAEMGLEIAS